MGETKRRPCANCCRNNSYNSKHTRGRIHFRHRHTQSDDMKRAAYEIYALGPKSVIVTGGHLSGPTCCMMATFSCLEAS